MKRKPKTLVVPITRQEAEKIELIAKARGMTPEQFMEELIEDALEELRMELGMTLPERGAVH